MPEILIFLASRNKANMLFGTKPNTNFSIFFFEREFLEFKRNIKRIFFCEFTLLFEFFYFTDLFIKFYICRYE